MRWQQRRAHLRMGERVSTSSAMCVAMAMSLEARYAAADCSMARRSPPRDASSLHCGAPVLFPTPPSSLRVDGFSENEITELLAPLRHGTLFVGEPREGVGEAGGPSRREFLGI